MVAGASAPPRRWLGRRPHRRVGRAQRRWRARAGRRVLVRSAVGRQRRQRARVLTHRQRVDARPAALRHDRCGRLLVRIRGGDHVRWLTRDHRIALREPRCGVEPLRHHVDGGSCALAWLARLDGRVRSLRGGQRRRCARGRGRATSWSERSRRRVRVHARRRRVDPRSAVAAGVGGIVRLRGHEPRSRQLGHAGRDRSAGHHDQRRVRCRARERVHPGGDDVDRAAVVAPVGHAREQRSVRLLRAHERRRSTRDRRDAWGLDVRWKRPCVHLERQLG